MTARRVLLAALGALTPLALRSVRQRLLRASDTQVHRVVHR